MKTLIVFLMIAVLSSNNYSQITNENKPFETKAPGTYKINSGEDEVIIPFEFFVNKMVFQAEMNKKKIKFMIDNGVVWNELCFFGSSIVDSLGMQYEGTGLITGAGEGSELKSFTASGVSISFPGIDFFNQPAIITAKDQGFADFFPGIAGQVSGAFFKHFVVEFDFDEKLIKLHKPENYKYSGNGQRLNMRRDSLEESYSIPLELNKNGKDGVKCELRIDLGGIHPLRVVINEKKGINKPLNAIIKSLGFGASGEIFGYEGNFENVKIAGYDIKNVPAVFAESENEGDNTNLTIGLPLLMRFNLVFDYFKQILYIEPNRNFDLPILEK